MPNSSEKEKKITQSTVVHQYGISKKKIAQYLPKPERVPNPYYKNAPPMLLWKESDVLAVLKEHPELAFTAQKKSKRENPAQKKEKNIIRFLESFSPQKMLDRGAELERKFILHIGPTNSGKTYKALETLKQTADGLYLGPLRLLALEVSEGLNAAGYPCSLLTGEEALRVPNALYTASTIELCDYDHHYETIVIDEAQMIADPFRGNQWFKAICMANADTVVVCGAPEVQELLEHMCREMNTPYEVVYHERMVPLQFSGICRSFDEVLPGDALISFGRKKVLAIAAELERKGKKVSVIYGALPPASRREEVRRFSAKETSVVVATDAIGMGISLPIRRILFTEAKKYNGDNVYPLTYSEIKQIAGRAGRFGQYDLGEVLTMDNPALIKQGMEELVKPIRKFTIGFPEEALEFDSSLADMLKIWDNLPAQSTFERANMKDARFLLSALGKNAKGFPKDVIYPLITCPVDVKKEELVEYWVNCCLRILEGNVPSKPKMPESTLETCEIKYRAYDIYHQLLRRIGIEDDCMEEKTALCEKINQFLKKSKFQKKKKEFHGWDDFYW